MVDRTDAFVGARVRAARLAHGLTQREFARRLGVSKQQVWKYENGESQLSVSRLAQIARLLGLSPSVLLDQPAPLDASQMSVGSGRQAELLDLYHKLDREDQDLLVSIGRSVAEANRKKALATGAVSSSRNVAATSTIVFSPNEARRSFDIVNQH